MVAKKSASACPNGKSYTLAMKLTKYLKIFAPILVIFLAVYAWKSYEARESERISNSLQRPAVRMYRPPPGFVRDPRAQQLQANATRSMIRKNFPQAVNELKQSLEVQENPQVRYILGKAQAWAGNRGEAINTLKQVAKGKGDAAEFARNTLGEMERDPDWGADKRAPKP